MCSGWLETRQHALVVAADTTVALGKEVLEKPADAEDARRMLRRLSDGEHRVYTGFCLRQGARQISGVEETTVAFYPISEEELEEYVQSPEPYDKAGAYGIQGPAARFVRGVYGCYFNVMGLPVGRLWQELRNFKA
jgi:septum formation protein